MKFNSIRFKISILYVCILGVILIIYSTALYFNLKHTLYHIFDEELAIKAKAIDTTINLYLTRLVCDQQSFLFALKRIIKLESEHPDQNKIAEIEKELYQKGDAINLREDYVNVLTIDGLPLIHSVNLTEDILNSFSRYSAKIRDQGKIFKNITCNTIQLRTISLVVSSPCQGNYILQLGTSLTPITHILKERLLFIVISIAVILFIAGFIGQIFASRILKPVVEITSTAQNITHENLSARVKAEHIDVEMKYLVNAFNDMIIRLEESFKYIIELSSHIAHELKTPLAIIIGESEVALRKDQGKEEYRRVITVIIEESGRMLKTINDLLLLTRLDYQSEIFKFEKIDITEFMQEIYEQSKILAIKKDIIVKIDTSVDYLIINADKLHLRRLFFNLIDNAIKFTPSHGHIDILLSHDEHNALISITDTGIGISEKYLPEVFNRFFHGDKTSIDDESGSGLGLSIALSIAKMHHGDISVKSGSGKGSVFMVTLPLIHA